MKSLIAAASALAVAAIAAPAFAQDSSAMALSGYTNLGYANADSQGTDLNVLGGRAGFKVGQFIGAEGELAFGIGNTSVGGGVNAKVQDAYAAYLVAHLPLGPNAEVFARGGAGYTNMHYSGAVSGENGASSWNYGAGAEYFLTHHDGLRVDYTRESFNHNQGHSNVWGVAWVHRFP